MHHITGQLARVVDKEISVLFVIDSHCEIGQVNNQCVLET
jgi:hypothetical protein